MSADQPSRTSEMEAAVCRAITSSAVTTLAAELIARPSVSGDEGAFQSWLPGRLSQLGLDVDSVDLDLAGLSEHWAFSSEFERGQAVAVLAGIGGADQDGGTSARTLLIDAHVDVVPAGHEQDWTSPAFRPEVRDGRLYGRGACDMKGGLAAAAVALAAIRDAGVELPGWVRLACVVGEEDGGSGTLGLLATGLRADGCLIPEPTDLVVAPAVAGALSWRVTIRGRSAHGCLREEGVSAIEKFAVVQHAVADLERRRNDRATPGFTWLDRPFAICGGRIEGGDWASSECDWLVWEGRYGVSPDEDLDAARTEFEQAVATACRQDDWLDKHPATVQWWGGQFLPARTDTADPVVAEVIGAVRAVRRDADEPVLVRGMPYGCNAGLTVQVAGIPTVVFGPGDIRDAHRPDESVAVADLVDAARAIALFVLRYCGAGSDPGTHVPDPVDVVADRAVGGEEAAARHVEDRLA